MTKKNKDEDEKDKEDADSPFDFLNFLKDPTKLFKNRKFRQLFDQIFEKVSENLPANFQDLSPEDIRKELMKNKDKFGFKGPFLYGFNVNIGPDGKPTVDSFGNLKQKAGEPEKHEVDDVRKPLIEVDEQGINIIVIAEMPGVTKKDIELKATSHSLTISTKNSEFGRNYYKEIELPAAINSDYAKARYQNGILEVKLKKIDEKQTDIKIDWAWRIFSRILFILPFALPFMVCITPVFAVRKV